MPSLKKILKKVKKTLDLYTGFAVYSSMRNERLTKNLKIKGNK